MENIPTKVDGVDVLPADEWNQVPTEIENAILSTGIVLSSGDLFQLGKAVADYSAHGDFYSDSGSANTYVLSALGSKQAPTKYADGMRIRFEVGIPNTGASTVNVVGLGVKNIKTPSGFNPVSGDITGKLTLEYDLSNGYFIIYDVASGGAIESSIIGNNTIINPSGIVSQRTDHTLVKDIYGFGPDRFAGMATGTLVNAGTLIQTATANVGVTGFAHKFNQVTLTGAGILFHRTRIESRDAKNYKNLKGAISCKVYHNVGSTIDYTITVRKADVEDDFTATTDISNDGGTSVNSATATELKFEDISMGDCSNGIEIEVKIECGAITLKDFELTEYNLKVGINATPSKPELIETVLAQCKRYFERLDYDSIPGEIIASGYAELTTQARAFLPFVEKRKAPELSSSAFGTFRVVRTGTDRVCDVSISFDLTGKKGTRIQLTFTTGLSTGEGLTVTRDGSDVCFIDLDSELT